MSNNELNDLQAERAKRFDKFLSSLPQFEKAPNWLIMSLSTIIPPYCIFKRTIFIKGKLICYIPELCKVNPFYNLIIQYRMNSYKA